MLVTAGMPTLAVLIGILLNQVQLSALSARVDALITKVGSLSERVAALEVRVAHLQESENH